MSKATDFLAITGALVAAGGGYSRAPQRRDDVGHGLSDREWRRRKQRRKMQRESRRRNRS